MSSAAGRDVKWGVLGAGWLVQTATGDAIHHAAGAQLYATGARDIARAQGTGAVVAYDNYQAVIDDPEVEAVYICLSNEAHLPWIRASIAAGKHVLCEKPMVLTEAEAAAAFAEADAAGVLLVEAVWSRWHPRMRRIIELASTGSLGEITNYLATFTFDGVAPDNYRLSPEHGGGALYDVGIYPLHGMFGVLPEVESVTVIEADYDRNERGVDLTTKATLTWGGDTRSSIAGSFVMPASQRLTVIGTEGEVRVEDNEAFATHRKPTELMVNGHIESFPTTDAYQVMFEEVSACIRGEEGWLLPARDSLRVARTVDSLL